MTFYPQPLPALTVRAFEIFSEPEPVRLEVIYSAQDLERLAEATRLQWANQPPDQGS